jgi:hypothetical protein
MLTIATAIQLLINAQLLNLARQHHGKSSNLAQSCRRSCESIGKSLCDGFLADLKDVAQDLSRNVVLLTGWCAVFLFQVRLQITFSVLTYHADYITLIEQLDMEKYAILSAQIVLAFAGRGDEQNPAHERFQNLYGMLLLCILSDSLDKDMTQELTERTASSGPRLQKRNGTNDEGVVSESPTFDVETTLNDSHQALQSLLLANEPYFAEAAHYVASPSIQNVLDFEWSFM